MDLCKYKNIFGEPGKGVHQYRIMNIAIVDVVATILLALLLSNVFKHSFWFSLGYLIIIMIIAHRAFCVRTTTDKLLFPNK